MHGASRLSDTTSSDESRSTMIQFFVVTSKCLTNPPTSPRTVLKLNTLTIRTAHQHQFRKRYILLGMYIIMVLVMVIIMKTLPHPEKMKDVVTPLVEKVSQPHPVTDRRVIENAIAGNLRRSEKMQEEMVGLQSDVDKSADPDTLITPQIEEENTFQMAHKISHSISSLESETKKGREHFISELAAFPVPQGEIDAPSSIESNIKNILPQRPSYQSKPSDKILVVYSGPTVLPNQDLLNVLAHGTDTEKEEQMSLHDNNMFLFDEEKKKELYRLNFEHFLLFGAECTSHDTVLVVTEAVAEHYRPLINSIRRRCKGGHQILVGTREDKCLDMEAMYRVMHDKDIVNIKDYNYLVYINCGVTGPSPDWSGDWINLFLSKLNDRVRMSGLTLNCAMSIPHIQSMAFALDRVGIELIQKSGAVFDCIEAFEKFTNKPDSDTSKDHMQNLIIDRYEVGMSKVILESGYGISPIIRPIEISDIEGQLCRMSDHYEDIWLTDAMKNQFGHVLRLDESVFFKTSRILTNETAKIINYIYEIDWSW